MSDERNPLTAGKDAGREHEYQLGEMPSARASGPGILLDGRTGKRGLSRPKGGPMHDEDHREIWLVHGTTGEYSDRCEWIVEARRSEAEAQARVWQLGELMQQLGCGIGAYKQSSVPGAVTAMKEHKNGDPNFCSDYTGTSYYMSSCVLK